MEALILDVLKKRGGDDEPFPTGNATLGSNEKYGPDVVQLKGKCKPEHLGRGANALATPEVPGYKQLISAVAQKLGWNIDEFDAWRIRVEFPIYHSTISLGWPDQKSPKQ